jgi:hypothetical protein
VGAPRAILVYVGGEWVNDYGNGRYGQDLDYSDSLAEGFCHMMRYHHHGLEFVRGNGNAHERDFTHNDFCGDSLNNVETLNFCYFAGHGGNVPDFHVMSINFGCLEDTQTSQSMRWKLGSGGLKWMVLDTCSLVCNTDAEHIVRSWAHPMRGLHMLFGFVGNDSTCWSTNDVGSDFADSAGTGGKLARAWLDAASSVWTDNVPIAIAAGVNQSDAVDRRENENTDYRDRAVPSTNWLAWGYREDWYSIERADSAHA